MLVRITHSCDMGCPHCMIEATPDGEHMAIKTFARAVAMAVAIGDRAILVSGGEPTRHPSLLDFLWLVQTAKLYTVLLSNGEFLHADEEYRDKVLSVADMVQVTNDPRYYPRHVADFKHPKVCFERSIACVSPFGRAVTNNIASPRQSPHCFNLRSLARATGSFVAAVQHERAMHKMCTPSINPDGSISAGEGRYCTKIGTVFDSFDTIDKNVCSMTCSKCGLVENLAQNYKRAIGEASLFLGDEP